MTYELVLPKCPTKGEGCELWPDPVTLVLQVAGWLVGLTLVVGLGLYLVFNLLKNRDRRQGRS